MTPEQSEAALQKRIDALPSRTVAALLDTMIEFYRDQRAEGPELDADGDMLPYQWGPDGQRFMLGLVRQFILPDEDEPFQLHLDMYFAASGELTALGTKSHWCATPNELDDFQRIIRDSLPFKALHDQQPEVVQVLFEQC